MVSSYGQIRAVVDATASKLPAGTKFTFARIIAPAVTVSVHPMRIALLR